MPYKYRILYKQCIMQFVIHYESFSTNVWNTAVKKKGLPKRRGDGVAERVFRIEKIVDKYPGGVYYRRVVNTR